MLSDNNEDAKIDRWDYFPTAHFSYNISKKYKLMASYSRRIERPRGWWLEPFLTWEDAYNVRSGNPNLQPEYIDAYELNFITNMGKNFSP
ncbi:MAG: TonB-dependent receptor [Chloroflexia bacterium]|nr:TonB-dependent receptor [Chloroflexia bacterium]